MQLDPFLLLACAVAGAGFTASLYMWWQQRAFDQQLALLFYREKQRQKQRRHPKSKEIVRIFR